MDAIEYTNMVMDRVLGALRCPTPAQENVARMAALLNSPAVLTEDIEALEECIREAAQEMGRNREQINQLQSRNRDLAESLLQAKIDIKRKREQLEAR